MCLLLARPQSAYSFAIAAKEAIDWRGHSVAFDSFDSGATNYPGYWTNSIRMATGDVLAGNLTNSVPNSGDLYLAGHLVTGSPFIFVTNFSIGDLAWVDSGTQGIKPGWVADDIVVFKNVTIPTNQTWWNAGTVGEGSSGTISGVTYAHVFTAASNGKYYIVNDSGDIFVGTNVNISIKAKLLLGTYNPNNIYVAGTGSEAGKLACYVDCTNCTVGAGYRTQSKLAQNLVFLGTTNCTSLGYRGNGDFTGVLYFPQANFQLAGGGSGVIDILGSIVAKSVQLNGYYDFHADEAVFRLSSPMPFLFASPDYTQSVLTGQRTTLYVSAVGARPFAYQWSYAGTNLLDATNSSLSLTNIQLPDAGLYQVTITNVASSVTSSVQLQVYSSPIPTLAAPTLSSNGQFQASISGVPGFSYRMEGSTNLSDWVPVSINVSPYTFTDTNTESFPQRYYRAIYVPLP